VENYSERMLGILQVEKGKRSDKAATFKLGITANPARQIELLSLAVVLSLNNERWTGFLF
jgi:hypothetical protein